MIFIASCDTVQTKYVCEELQKAEIAPKVQCDISFKPNNERCRCRCFDFNSWEKLDDEACGDFVSGNYPVQHCDGLGGFFNEDMATDIRPKIKLLYQTKTQFCD